MDRENIVITHNGNNYEIDIIGKATFEESAYIRDFSDKVSLKNINNIKKININFGKCTWLDSTFMGSLAILGLSAKEAHIEVELINISDENLTLLKELGIDNLFIFRDSRPIENHWEIVENRFLTQNDKDRGMLILEAHKTLMRIDKRNISKFQRLVELIEDERNSTVKGNA